MVQKTFVVIKGTKDIFEFPSKQKAKSFQKEISKRGYETATAQTRTNSHWYLSSSTISTNKKEAERIADDLRFKGLYKRVTVKPRFDGYWVRVEK